jgi:hypothetical protein
MVVQKAAVRARTQRLRERAAGRAVRLEQRVIVRHRGVRALGAARERGGEQAVDVE